MLLTQLDPTRLFSLRKRMVLRIGFLTKKFGKELVSFLRSDTLVLNASPIESDLAIIKKFAEEKLVKLLEEVFDSKSFEAWWRKVIRVAYSRGVVAGFTDLKAIAPITPLQPFAQLATELGKIAVVRELADQSLAVLVDRVVSELGLTTSRSVTHLNGELGTLLASGKSPRQIASELVADVIRSLNHNLVRTMQTETTRAFAWGKLDAANLLGLENVTVKAEIHGINDTRRCVRCQEIDGAVFSVSEARSIIPLHPACRCTYILISEAEADKKEQLRRSVLLSTLGLEKGE